VFLKYELIKIEFLYSCLVISQGELVKHAKANG
jgi:hypothetical protein